MDFAVPAHHRGKLKESEKGDLKNWKKRWKKLWNVKVVVIVIAALGTVTKRLVQGQEDFRDKSTSWDHPKYIIIKIGQNTEKSSGDLKRFAVPQTPVRNHQLTLVWETIKRVK